MSAMPEIPPIPRLNELLSGIAPAGAAVPNLPVAGLALDSRAIRAGWLFLAVPGTARDGREFIAEAVARGAAAILYETDGRFAPPSSPVPLIAVDDLRQRVGLIAERFYGEPSRHLAVIGVTGTNGKTTCTHLLAQALDVPGRRCAVLGTVGNGFPDALDASTHTTPDAVRLHGLLADLVRAGAASVAMEVSSHALDQGRVAGVRFGLALLTNLSHDHLDYHATMEAYGAAKARLFESDGLKHAVINADDPFGRSLIARVSKRVPVAGYGLRHGEFRALEVHPVSAGLRLRFAAPGGEVSFESGLLGRFNAENLLAVFATLVTLGLAPAEAAARLAQARPPAGRMERFGGGVKPLVIVDYAHSPDALEKVLAALREHARGRLVCIFGCGGERDRAKRPRMGAIAARLADEVILTDDNPRGEDGGAIIGEIADGMPELPRVIRDRRTAIARALAGAQADDIVLVAGKGHEDYQQIGAERHPYSDRATVREILGVEANG